jgi:hypothetical protein
MYVIQFHLRNSSLCWRAKGDTVVLRHCLGDAKGGGQVFRLDVAGQLANGERRALPDADHRICLQSCFPKPTSQWLYDEVYLFAFDYNLLIAFVFADDRAGAIVRCVRNGPGGSGGSVSV